MMEIPTELEKEMTVLNYPLPSREDLSALLDKIIADVSSSSRSASNWTTPAASACLQAALGLTLGEAENVFAKIIVKDERLSGDDVNEVFAEKQQIIRKSGLLEYYATSEGFRQHRRPGRAQRLAEQARRWPSPTKPAPLACPPPKASSCSACKAAAKAFAPRPSPPNGNCPCSASTWAACSAASSAPPRKTSAAPSPSPNPSPRPSSGWTKSTRPSPAPKAPGATDGGTTARVFGTFLTWLSEKTAPVFVVATANDISQLPPELLRKGRLDEIFFVDLPSRDEREEIFRIHLDKRGRDAAGFDLAALADASRDFSGAEIEEAINSALYDAFYAQQEMTTEHVLTPWPKPSRWPRPWTSKSTACAVGPRAAPATPASRRDQKAAPDAAWNCNPRQTTWAHFGATVLKTSARAADTAGCFSSHALAGLSALLLFVALLAQTDRVYSRVTLGALLFIAVFYFWRAVRQARRNRQRYSIQPLSREEMRKARAKLLGNQTPRKL